MPFYVYRCPHCGHERTEMRPIADRNKNRPVCPRGLDKADFVAMDLTISAAYGVVKDPAAGPRKGSL